MQTEGPGERSARRIPLKATTLEAARNEMADIKRKNLGKGLPSTGLRPLFMNLCCKRGVSDVFGVVPDLKTPFRNHSSLIPGLVRLMGPMDQILGLPRLSHGAPVSRVASGSGEGTSRLLA